MNADTQLSRNQITEKIKGCAYVVANSLGSGFLEKVYQKETAPECEGNPGLICVHLRFPRW